MRYALLALLAAVCVLIIACGDDDADPTPTGASPTASQNRTPGTGPSDTPSATPTSAPLSEPPDRDLLDLARRFFSYDGPTVARTEPYNHQVGDQVTFAMLDLDLIEEYDITATVRAVTEHAYFFVEDGAAYSQSAVDSAAADFEEIVCPTITGSFGEPTIPGVDGDPRITILNANLAGAGGFVAGSDAFPVGAVPRSNQREMMYVEAGALGSGDAYNALVAHELQHLIHQENDVNEESWVNEGLSEVAWEMAGGGADGVWEFLGAPDTQLNYWDPDAQSIHYAESELFLTYLLDHYGGRENGLALASQKANGIPGVEAYLAEFGRTFNEVFADFAVANLLDDGDGPYSHLNFDGTVSTAIAEIEAGDGDTDRVSQFGTDYLRIEEGGVFTFDGGDEVTIGIPALDGPFFWSDRSDGIDSRLTREVDLTDVTAATLEFDAWWDIEGGWDYAYIVVSNDGGETWVALPATDTTDDNPVSAAYGPGYTDASSGWAHQQVDLSDYAGSEILIRFEYITDDATHLTGFAVDNITIGAIGLAEDGESLDGWQLEGFEQITGSMQQEFIVQVITDDGEIDTVDLGPGNTATIELGGVTTIAISGATQHTTEHATYEWSYH